VRLATAYWRRHRHQASRSDLDRAIGLGEQAVARTPGDHVNLPGWLSNLAEARLDRYRLDRAPADVDAAVDLGEQALVNMPADPPGRLRLTANVCAAFLEPSGWSRRAPPRRGCTRPRAGSWPPASNCTRRSSSALRATPRTRSPRRSTSSGWSTRRWPRSTSW